MNDLGTEMKGKFAGPISPSEFLQTFLPFKRGELGRMPGRRKKAFQRVADQKTEAAMYGPMIVALKHYCPGFDLVDTHNHQDMSASKTEPAIKPDVSLYISGCRTDPTIITDVSLIDIQMEFKLDPNDDPFRDHDAFEKDTLRSADTRGQITFYATKQLASQFRTHAFSVIICKDTARLIHWDRSGAVVTQAFSYVEEAWLASFFWRYTHSSRAVHGVDESVTAPTDADAAYVQRARAALELDDDKPLFKFAVYSDNEDVSYYFGSNPWFKGNGSPTGRATRVFIVYDPVLDRRVLMKDTWRVSLHGMQTEGAIYTRLHAANVSHIPHFIRGGDVTSPFCRTRSHKFAKQFDLRLRPHSHYRLILGDIGRDLTSFTTTKELVEALTGGLQGT
ncbi:hypothetical protein BYT27DRAFT_7151134 [Phlegmacium glaucopus]|nr:hypothetical protein BYT27DRAFT_7151134 [Phlegmacium glaucopus]